MTRTPHEAVREAVARTIEAKLIERIPYLKAEPRFVGSGYALAVDLLPIFATQTAATEAEPCGDWPDRLALARTLARVAVEKAPESFGFAHSEQYTVAAVEQIVERSWPSYTREAEAILALAPPPAKPDLSTWPESLAIRLRHRIDGTDGDSITIGKLLASEVVEALNRLVLREDASPAKPDPSDGLVEALVEALKGYDNAFTDFNPDQRDSRFAMRKAIIAARAALKQAEAAP